MRDDGTIHGGQSTYGKPAKWRKPPTEEEIEDILDTLVGEDEIEVTERTHPFEEERSESSVSELFDQPNG